MLPEKIMQSDLLDILFENRNKNYGAYTLRKFYYQRLNFAISTTIFLSAFISVIMLLHHNKKMDYITTVIIPPDAELTSIPPDKPIISKPAHVQPVNHFKQINNSAPVIAPDDIKPTMPTITQIDNSIISNVNTDGETPPDNIINSPAGSGNARVAMATATPVIDDNTPLITAEVMPEFPGGINALVKFIQKNARQPDDLQAGDAIKVIASFVVSKTGSIENVKITSTGRSDLDKEVIRIIKKMPLWKPGLQNGKPVSVYFNLPVTFQSADE